MWISFRGVEPASGTNRYLGPNFSHRSIFRNVPCRLLPSKRLLRAAGITVRSHPGATLVSLRQTKPQAPMMPLRAYKIALSLKPGIRSILIRLEIWPEEIHRHAADSDQVLVVSIRHRVRKLGYATFRQERLSFLRGLELGRI